MPNRDQVTESIYNALAPYDLGWCTDGVMDSLDTVIDWDDEEEWDDEDD